MKSLKEHFEQLKNWDYYEREKKLSINKIANWNTNQEHKDFIEGFLKISGKMDIQVAFENINNIKLEDFKRLDHINSVFFLGCALYENTIFKDKINFYRKDDKAKENDEFHFIWFLTSLIHDFSYQIENNTTEKFNDLDNNLNFRT